MFGLEIVVPQLVIVPLSTLAVGIARWVWEDNEVKQGRRKFEGWQPNYPKQRK